MRKLTFLALICLFVMGNAAFSQSFEFRHANGGEKISDTLFIDVDSETLNALGEGERHIDIKNLTGNNLNARVVGSRLNNFGSSDYVNYCYVGACPEEGAPTNDFALSADELLEGFFIDFYVPNVGIFYFKLQVYNDQNIEDEESIVIALERRSSEIKFAEKFAIKADIYPNPASDNIKIKYDLGGTFSANSQLIIRNLVGAVVKTIPLKPTEKEAIASVSDLSSGIYFYSLSIDGVIQNTKKLIIKK